MKAQLASVLIVILLFVAAFGLPVLLSHTDHHFGCPLQTAQAALCSEAALEHLSLWQSMFSSILSVFVLFIGLAVFRVGTPMCVSETVRLRSYQWNPRPTLYQELVSRGIHNRKEP
ncbi:hypothetical protein JNK62_00830 [bacterium]|nr:hypothetical protein [bacterium]